MFSFSIMFSHILIACGGKDTDSGTEDSGVVSPTTIAAVTHDLDTCEGLDDWCSAASMTFEWDRESLETYIGDDNAVSAEECSNICIGALEEAQEYYDYLCSCDYQGLNEQNKDVIVCSYYNNCMVEGRAHADVERVHVGHGKTRKGAWLSKATHSEATSVIAFLQLYQELGTHGAPQDLRMRCLQAAQEEKNHMEMLCTHARNERGIFPELKSISTPSRSLFEIAMENAIEGCVNETYAALQAHHQAIHAHEKSIRETFAQIAHDETKHAELAYHLHAWCMTQLTQDEIAQIHTAQKTAFARLIRYLETQEDDTELIALGIPSAQRASQMVHLLKEKLTDVAA